MDVLESIHMAFLLSVKQTLSMKSNSFPNIEELMLIISTRQC